MSKECSYKSLSWREKDRRRKFRDEWRKTWLVVPHGKYGVICLLCHKVMTQRKLDTIKRHVLRRHATLVDLNTSQRSFLFQQLLHRYPIDNDKLFYKFGSEGEILSPMFINIIPLKETIQFFYFKIMYSFFMPIFYEILNKPESFEKEHFDINKKMSSRSKSLFIDQLLEADDLTK